MAVRRLRCLLFGVACISLVLASVVIFSSLPASQPSIAALGEKHPSQIHGPKDQRSHNETTVRPGPTQLSTTSTGSQAFIPSLPQGSLKPRRTLAAKSRLGECVEVLASVTVTAGSLYAVGFQIAPHSKSDARSQTKTREDSVFDPESLPLRIQDQSGHLLPHSRLKATPLSTPSAQVTYETTTVFRSLSTSTSVTACLLTAAGETWSVSEFDIVYLSRSRDDLKIPSHSTHPVVGQFLVADPVVVSMAMIAERSRGGYDAAMSLYPFVDHIHVFAPNVSAIRPELLKLPKFSFAFAHDCDNFGDAGKFYWAEQDSSRYKYHFTIDDDILYPPDYVRVMVDWMKHFNDSVFVGVHCVNVKQPLRKYYSWETKFTQHFHMNLTSLYPAHIIGSGTLAYPLSRYTIPFANFRHRNMADLWVTQYALSNKVARICVPRPDKWLVINEAILSSSSIYAASNTKEKTAAFILKDSGDAQSLLAQGLWPITYFAPRSVLTFALVILCDAVHQVKAMIPSFMTHRTRDASWILVLAQPGGAPSKDVDMYLRRRLTLNFTEIHVLPYSSTPLSKCQQFNSALSLLDQLRFDLAFFVSDTIEFRQPGWDTLYWSSVQQAGFDHFAFRGAWSNAPCLPVNTKSSDAGVCAVPFTPSTAQRQQSPPLFTVTPRMITSVGYCDPSTESDSWYASMVARWERASFSPIDRLLDNHRSTSMLLDHARTAHRDDQVANTVSDQRHAPSEMKHPLFRSRADIGLVPFSYGFSKPLMGTQRGLFQRTFLLCLPSNKVCTETEQRLRQLSFEPKWFPEDAGVADALWTHYQTTHAASRTTTNKTTPAQLVPRSASPAHIQSSPILTEYDFFEKQSCPVARQKYFEAHPEVADALTATLTQLDVRLISAWIGVLKSAITQQLSSILVVDGHVLLHSDIDNLLPLLKADLPADWLMVYLGGLQNHWDDNWISPVTQHLIRGNGSTRGFMGILLRDEIFIDLLHHLLRLDLPVDIGAFSAVCNRFKSRCFTAVPSLFSLPTLQGDDWSKYRVNKEDYS